MKDIKKIIKLDYISIKPYFTLKNLAIMVFLYLFYCYLSKNPIIAIAMPIFFAIIYSSYPFLIGEEAGIDGLYKILGINYKNVVRGRYLFSLVLFVISIIIGMIFFILTLFFVKKIDIKIIFPNIAAYLIIYIILISFQYPLYFNYGYKKAKTLSFFTFLAFGVLSFATVYLRDNIKGMLILMTENKFFSLLIIELIILVIISSSIKISEKYYKKREF